MLDIIFFETEIMQISLYQAGPAAALYVAEIKGQGGLDLDYLGTAQMT